ncbi:MAG: tRNA (N6-isopentenyl adenosine(37)-C2)-methylthiotransferase MiaB [Eubacteriales bacterium]
MESEKKRIITEAEMEKQREYAKNISAMIRGEKSACVITYGCQQNEADSERIAGTLADMGYKIVDAAADADLIIVNTCAVRDHAEKKALSITGGYKHLKEKNPELKIGICGCMVSQTSMSDKIKKSYPYVDFVFGTEHLWRLPEMLYHTMTEGRSFYPNEGDAVLAEGVPVRRESKFRAWVSIMYGCNNFCTYCIVPYVRGRERSRRPEDIEEEVRALVSDGCKEITLLGQNVNSYGKEFGGECDFADLLARLSKLDGDFIIRFMTSHPKDASKKLIDTMAENPKIARHFHLPLQSGSDRILREMNRHYDTAAYMELIGYMREKMPDISISTDIIVGFPGETEEDFEATLDTVRRVKYDMLFSFIYSKRDGTPAAKMENQVPDEVKSTRFARLVEAQAENALACNLPLEGKTVRILVEGESKTDPDMFSGRTGGNKIVHIPADESLRGQFANVRITKALTYALTGEVVK